MTPVRMIHPHHGATHAYTHDDIEKLKALGWSEEQPTQEAMLENIPKRRGRPKKVTENVNDPGHH